MKLAKFKGFVPTFKMVDGEIRVYNGLGGWIRTYKNNKHTSIEQFIHTFESQGFKVEI